ncbi:hypothetical protein SAMN05443572_103167 [Myxococcus fulvus]|uniref:DZANK-type domain-containing protein n=1 Tax=Myxococcus fulvus TaxID=33 RepID=A0A511TE88_MYXFU|nr:hypothetical protein [Myxococcus fulvus]AKF81953.1 hypothetical protein MFUL124B02_24375 [Myxococcus fulvus 124B02]GEN12481.1 hypothetical protein MFU01_75180 [Myxococcus fulvus]SET77445.1 hypothetical protein SAMN05443572_103167 [Myxococcus fulvus]
MIICPVCDHVQPEGTECDVCGKRFPVAAAGATPPVAPLPELELTPHAGGRDAVNAQPLPELDITRLRSGPDLPPQVVQDLELTRSAPTGDLPVAVLPELDTGRAPDDGVRTAAPLGAVTCRYCRNVQAQGLLCDNCGMRLPRARVAPAVVAGKPGADDDNWMACPSCHTRGRPGRACSECGTRLQEKT